MASNAERREGRIAELVADAMFALSTPSRVELLLRLAQGPCSVTELVEQVGGEQSAISHQLRVLREHSLVQVRRDGRRRVYMLADDEVAGLLDHAVHHVTEPRAKRSHRPTTAKAE